MKEKVNLKTLETTIQVYPNNSVVDNAKTFPSAASSSTPTSRIQSQILESREMNQEQFTIGQGPVIIAMKGHPGSGKSTLAQSIARVLRCPLIDKDDVRDSTSPLEPSTPDRLLNTLSYDVIWQIASTQLRLGLSVVLDSPLSRRSHLDSLRRLAASSAASLLVVECRPRDHSEWRRRLERRGLGESDGSSWHKPSTWQDLERLLEEYDGCTNYEFGDVPRMVVDTTAQVGLGEMVSAVVEFIAAHAGGEHSHKVSNEVSTRMYIGCNS